MACMPNGMTTGSGEVQEHVETCDGWVRPESWSDEHGVWWEWWDGDMPKLRLLLPSDVILTPIMKDLIEDAFSQGERRGERRGEFALQSKLRILLGVSQ